MVRKVLGEIRTGQLVTTYGIGSIVPVDEKSFMVAGLDEWDVDGPGVKRVSEPLLQRWLRVRRLIRPRASEHGRDVPVVRFPVWHHCPKCRRLAPIGQFGGVRESLCRACNVSLIPSRFVAVCDRGHIDDFPWMRWIHEGSPTGDGPHELQLDNTGATASLGSIVGSCSCEAERSLEGAFGRKALKDITRCWGSRPWLGDQEVDCPETPVVLQRGASNVWFSQVRSAISIPPWSEAVHQTIDRYWSLLRHADDASLPGMLEGLRQDQALRLSVDDMVTAVRQRRDGDTVAIASEEDLRRQEYEALMRGREEGEPGQQFVSVPIEDTGPTADAWFDRVMLVKRLREVRALTGFSRVTPAAPGDGRDAPLSREAVGWYPAIEVLGEGVFFRIADDRLLAWEERSDVIGRARLLDERYRSVRGRGGVEDRTVTPRLVGVHTLAHALIDEWALDSGYPAAALRERLYVSADMAGLLVYTATSDSAGSLGGVVAQAEPDRLETALGRVRERLGWCSADPLCIEVAAQGADALNLGACHACVLLPEVSCEEGNVLLDRGLLTGTLDEPSLGLLHPGLD